MISHYDLEPAQKEESDMPELSTEGLSQLRQRAIAEIDGGHIPSCQYALALDGRIVEQETLGAATPNNRYIIFSATKPIVASVVWQLIGKGHLDPALPVSTWWPEFADNGKDAVTLEHVLLHTGGFPYAKLDDAIANDRAARIAQMETWTLDWEPGSRYVYHPLSAHWVLAELITRVTGAGHRTVLRDNVLNPLGLDRLELGVPLDHQQDVLPLQKVGAPVPLEELSALLGVDSLEVPEEAVLDLTRFNNAEVRAAGVPGGGAASDAASVALFYQGLLNDRKQLWDPDLLADVTSNVRNRLPDPFGSPAMRTLGLEYAGDGEGSQFRIGMGGPSARTFGHNGAAGQIAWADPVSGLSFVFLTDGADQNIIREFTRGMDLNRLAAACVSN